MSEGETLEASQADTARSRDEAGPSGTSSVEAVRSASQDLIGEASPEAIRVALQLGTLFRRMLSYGAAASSFLDSGAFDLSFLEFKAMMNLGAFDSRSHLCLADLSQTTGASMPATSRAIDSLVRKGLVSRVEDPDDRRRRLVSLTDTGHEVTNAALMGRAIGAVKLADSFTAHELDELDRLLSRLVEGEDLAGIYTQLESAVDL